MTEFLRTSEPMAHVALIVIDHPPSNALGRGPLSELIAQLEAIDADTDVRAVILTGSGSAFCAGADLRERADGGALASSGTQLFGDMLERLDRMRPATIAAVNGYAFGGGLELALCCDLRIAASGARFAAAGVNVGLMASVYRLPRLIGVAQAKAMLLTGSPVSADRALHYGLVTEVHTEGALMDAAFALAARIASRAPLAVEAAKRQAGRALDMSPEEAQRAAAAELKVLAASEDHRAAIEAFAERSEPVFRRK